MRRLSRATWIAIVVTGILAMLGSVMGNIGATALTWLSPQVALVLFMLISLVLIGVSLWQEGQKAAAGARKYRKIMLSRVQTKWITGFLEDPLYYSYDEQLLPLPLRKRVGSRFDPVLPNPLEPTQTIPPGTTLAQVFDQAGGELLILGEPGAGKTTLLLELTRDLLKRAQDNPMAAIPVVLMLSSWAIRKLPLEQWIAEELQSKYNIPSKVGKEWVKTAQLLLLLDGLDEVAPSAVPACIEAINEYYHQAHRSLVVCSRTKEFLGQPERLALHSAVIVQPLSPEQIDNYLDDLTAKGEDVEGLKHTLPQSEELRVLATTPLFLTVLILAYHGKSVQDILVPMKATPADQQYMLFHNYVERMLQRKGIRMHVPVQQTKHYLAWLARQMTVDQWSEFYPGQLLTDWLPKRQRAFYQWSIGLVTGLGVGLLGYLIYVLLSGLAYGLAVRLGNNKPDSVQVLISGLLSGLLVSLSSRLLSDQVSMWLFMLSFGLLSGLGVGLSLGLSHGLPDALFSLLFAGMVSVLLFGQTGLVLGMAFGELVSNYILRFWFWPAKCTPAPWRYIAFLNDAVDQLLLRKVGGRYIFRHRLLQDYFASLDVASFS